MKRFAGILVLAAITYGANFWGYPIYILDEAKNTACAMEMAARNDWVVPTFNGQLRTDKPPLHYFFMRLSFEVFGVNPAGARIFSVLMGMLTVAAVYFFGQRLWNERVARWASLILLSSVQMMIQFHLAVPDPYLIFFFTLATLSFLYAWQTDQKMYFYVCYTALAFAFMAKGPLAVGLCGLAALLFILSQRSLSLRTLARIHVGGGVLIFLAMVLPWWIAVTLKTDGAWTRGFFFDHNLQRFSSTMEGHRGFPGLAIVYFLASLFPLSVFLPAASRLAWRQRKADPVLLYLLIAMGVVVAFFSLSRTILPGYLSPAVPLGSLLLAFYLDRAVSVGRVHRALAFFVLVVTVAAPVAGYFALKSDPLVFPEAGWAALLAVAIPGVAWGVWRLRQSLAHFALAAALSYGCMGVTLFYFLMPRLMHYNPVARSLRELHLQRPLACFVRTNPAFVFNLRHTYPVLHSPEEVQAWWARHPDGYILTRSDQSPAWGRLPVAEVFRGRDLFENHTTVILEKKTP